VTSPPDLLRNRRPLPISTPTREKVCASLPARDPPGVVMSNRPGPARTGPGTVFLARVLLLLTVSFLLAGAVVAALISMGADPIG
jgi:hypothetical protein